MGLNARSFPSIRARRAKAPSTWRSPPSSDRRGQGTNDVLEAADGRGDRLLDLLDLPCLLHEPVLGEGRPELRVRVGIARRDERVDLGVEAPPHARPDGRVERGRELAERPAVDPRGRLDLREPRPPPDPELAVAVVLEEVDRARVGGRSHEERRTVAAPVGVEHEHASGGMVSGQVDVVARRTEAVLLAVPSELGLAGRQDEPVIRELPRQPGAPERASRGELGRPVVCRLGGDPPLSQKDVESRRDRQVVAAGLERLPCRRVGWFPGRATTSATPA